ncbi:unnamed protein product [Polarella glacialis]|uniref:Uncharacterized protein n=1 Tax=Polarella glacialis TaxID=89957 RepID=A0A813E7N8_POLGL|nr:unnamed protein product [Polarella glacialis]
MAQGELRAAVAFGSVAATEAALATGASVNAPGPAGGWLPIHAASSQGHLGVLSLLIARRADVNAPSGRLYAQPVHLAAKEGHVEVLEYLLDLRADIDATDREERRPISLACQRAKLEVVKLLVERRADLLSPDEGRATPYDWAVSGLSVLGTDYEKSEQICNLLERHGAKVSGPCLGPLERCPYASSRGAPNC